MPIDVESVPTGVSPSIEPQLFSLEYFDLREAVHEPFAVRQNFGNRADISRHHGDANRGPLPKVLVVDLRHGHPMSIAKPVDDRPENRPFLLQRMGCGNVELNTKRAYKHRLLGPHTTLESRPGTSAEELDG